MVMSPNVLEFFYILWLRLGLFYPVTATLLYFNANIMFSFTKNFSFWGDFVHQIPYRGYTPGPRWVTSLLLCPRNNPVRSTPLQSLLGRTVYRPRAK